MAIVVSEAAKANKFGAGGTEETAPVSQ